jgi:hypothetical protein
VGEWKSGFTHLQTQHMMRVSGHLHALPALLPRIKPLVPIGLVAGLAPEPVWTRWQRDNFTPKYAKCETCSVVEFKRMFYSQVDVIL